MLFYLEYCINCLDNSNMVLINGLFQTLCDDISGWTHLRLR